MGCNTEGNKTVCGCHGDESVEFFYSRNAGHLMMILCPGAVDGLVRTAAANVILFCRAYNHRGKKGKTMGPDSLLLLEGTLEKLGYNVELHSQGYIGDLVQMLFAFAKYYAENENFSPDWRFDIKYEFAKLMTDALDAYEKWHKKVYKQLDCNCTAYNKQLLLRYKKA